MDLLAGRGKEMATESSSLPTGTDHVLEPGGLLGDAAKTGCGSNGAVEETCKPDTGIPAPPYIGIAAQ